MRGRARRAGRDLDHRPNPEGECQVTYREYQRSQRSTKSRPDLGSQTYALFTLVSAFCATGLLFGNVSFTPVKPSHHCSGYTPPTRHLVQIPDRVTPLRRRDSSWPPHISSGRGIVNLVADPCAGRERATPAGAPCTGCVRPSLLRKVDAINARRRTRTVDEARLTAGASAALAVIAAEVAGGTGTIRHRQHPERGLQPRPVAASGRGGRALNRPVVISVPNP